MKKFELNKENISDLTIKNKLYIIGAFWEATYSIREVRHDKIVILQNGKTSYDVLYISQESEYDFKIFVLDKEYQPEYWL